MPPKAFPFPILKHKELREMTKSFLGVESHPRDFEKPSPEFVTRVFEAVENTFLGPRQFDYDLLGATDFPELYTETAPRVAFFARLKQIFAKLMVKDFCFEDLTRPDGARFVMQMSGLMNFFRFRSERLAILNKCEENQMTITEERRALEEALHQKKSELSRIQEMHASEEKEVERLQPEWQNRRRRCVQLNKSHGQLFTQQNGMRAQANRLKDTLVATTFELNTKTQERENLEDQIVESPSKIQTKIAELSEQLKETRDITTTLLSTDTRLAEEIAAIQELGKRLKEHLELLSQIENAKIAKKEVSKRSKEMQQEVEKAKSAYRQIVDEIASLSGVYEKTTEQCRSAVQDYEAARGEAEIAVRNKKTEREKVEAQNTEVQSTVVAQANRQIQKWTEKSKALQEQHKSEMTLIAEKYKAAEMSFTQWCKRMEDAMNE